MHRKYGFDWNDNHNKFEHLLERIENAFQWVYDKTINKIFDRWPNRKIQVRIDNYDTWSMDDTLSHIIYPMLKLLQENKHGTPTVDENDVPEELRTRKDPTEEIPLVHDKTENLEKQWGWVLGEMVWAFEQKSRVEGWETDYYKEGEWTPKNFEKVNAHQDRMSNGFRLFGKYYECLWD
jgi:hypothetical protein